MDLRGKIKRDRKQRLTRKGVRGDAFLTVSSIIKAYGLNEDYLQSVRWRPEALQRSIPGTAQLKMKRAFEIPPFSEEVLLSGPLYSAKPSLGAEELLHHDFETLSTRGEPSSGRT